MLSELQKKKLTYYFHVFDADKNGVLEKSDFDKIVNEYAESYNIAKDSEIYQYISSTYGKRWEGLAKEADTNADNKVSLDEWLSYQDKLVNDPKSDFLWLKIASMFHDIQDINKDGSINLEEYQVLYKIHGIGNASLAAEIFYKLDFDGDGKIMKNDHLNLVADFYLSDNPQAPGNLFFGYYE
ncbi:EF-hand domain-containing protein [Nostoc sp. FACHB-133]|uniref:EF-hand domain-containing protein n=1 Tax=Nostoc sp. FACHB-133 TaxID=2692835 RepID=UPI0016858E32|nr:EF-hand domain-containing protein [Nostoc sp. FACHB-133]MBD2525721.1 EF-hand domain-containing protein [Nostoc sp. FACHB-133]